jgi:hypothetical protein
MLHDNMETTCENEEGGGDYGVVQEHVLYNGHCQLPQYDITVRATVSDALIANSAPAVILMSKPCLLIHGSRMQNESMGTGPSSYWRHRLDCNIAY